MSNLWMMLTHGTNL